MYVNTQYRWQAEERKCITHSTDGKQKRGNVCEHAVQIASRREEMYVNTQYRWQAEERKCM